MLVAAVIPHHHHPNGMICMKQDLPVEQQCPTHHHHPGNDHVAASECMTRFYSPIFHPYIRIADRIMYHRYLFTGCNHRTSITATRETD